MLRCDAMRCDAMYGGEVVDVDIDVFHVVVNNNTGSARGLVTRPVRSWLAAISAQPKAVYARNIRRGRRHLRPMSLDGHFSPEYLSCSSPHVKIVDRPVL
jgi:hypothetical protein